jgi:hypothetical protein
MPLLLLMYVDVTIECRHSCAVVFMVYVIFIVVAGAVAYLCLCFYRYLCFLIMSPFPLHED